jgi:hypothetical protein
MGKAAGVLKRALRPKMVVAVLGVVVVLLIVRQCSSSSPGFISDAQYRAIRIGASESELRTQFGAPLTLDSIPAVLPVPPGNECLYYSDDGTTIDDTTYRFCFKNGVLDLKDGYGPLFESGYLRPVHS